MNNKAHLRPQDYDGNGDIIPMACKEEKGDLISRADLLKKVICHTYPVDILENEHKVITEVLRLIGNAPSVDTYTIEDIQTVREDALILGAKLAQKPQNEYFDMSKLRLMTVEECAGHTIDYAMGWKACIEWIKKGGAE